MGYLTPPLDDPAHPETSSNYNIEVISKLEWAILIMQPLSLGFVKLSFVFFYRRVFLVHQTKRDGFNILTILCIVILVVWSIAYLFAELFVCKGHWAALWTNLETLTTQCIKTPKELLSLAISDFLTDLMVLCLPVHKIWKLHLSIRRKIAILAVFALGAVAIAMSIQRLSIFVWATTTSFTGADLDNNRISPDALESEKNESINAVLVLITRVLYWSVIEAGLALVACCLPTIHTSLRSAFDEASKQVRSSTSISSLISRKSRHSVRLSDEESQKMKSSAEAPSSVFMGYQTDTQLNSYALGNVSRESQTTGAIPSKSILVTKSLQQNKQVA